MTTVTTFETLLVATIDGHNRRSHRPVRTHTPEDANAINRGMVEDFREATNSITGQAQVRAIVFHARGAASVAADTSGLVGYDSDRRPRSYRTHSEDVQHDLRGRCGWPILTAPIGSRAGASF
jgi:enoyl-CoA hydratase/carnithine racemase